MNSSRDLADVAVMTKAGRTFYTLQIRRLMDLGIDAGHLAVSHLAIRAPSWTEYLHVRAGLEGSASANVENVWNGRPISKILLNTPVDLGAKGVELIELIPPFHQRTETRCRRSNPSPQRRAGSAQGFDQWQPRSRMSMTFAGCSTASSGWM